MSADPSEGRERAQLQDLITAQVGERMWKAELLRVVERLHKLAGTPTDSGYETALAKLEAGRSLEQERDELRKVVEALAGCMPDVIYVTEEKWSDQEPEIAEGQEENFVTIDFRKLVHKGDS